ncbi:50S ribosomal protein L24 [Candidatus Saccharibacteria bacterium]|nr:50S ribosomal protein L24 [Candidatus Saccharibacteria bacterium]
MRLKMGDTVMVRSGKYKGRTGKILATHPKLNAVIVEGLNVVTRHRKPTAANPRAGSVEIIRPLPVSKVGYYDATKKRPSRLGYRIVKGKPKTRVLKTSGKELK